MRPNNQNNNKRSRGRNNGRKNQNPLSRNFESNGPDVKVRGNAAHIAEKYVQLARDAQASGDSVSAENYFQHAEHYFRLVSAAQAQNPQRTEQPQPAQDQQKPGESDDYGGRTQSAQRDVTPETAKPENAPSEEAAAVKSDGETAVPAEVAEEKPRKPRERRPRRKPRVEADTSAAPTTPAEPDAAELPAFLTGGGQPDAAE